MRIALHWLTVLMVALAFVLVLAHESVETDASRAALMAWHRAAGVAALSLTLLRLLARRRWPWREVGALAVPAWQKLAARASHGLLLLALLGQPLIGWALTSARGQPVRLAPGLELPPLLARNLDLADTLEAAHGWVGWAMLALIGLHAAAALWHHRRRDPILAAMWPSTRLSGAPAGGRPN